jgi:hypothetical protein
MTLLRNLTGTTPAAASGDTPEGVSFDGSNDYLSRSTDLTGNADSKTFTFSAWVYVNNDSSFPVLMFRDIGVSITVNNNGKEIGFDFRNSAGVMVSWGGTSSTFDIRHTWSHILISFDMTSQAASKIYVNEISQTISFNAFVNNTIGFTRTPKGIMANPENTSQISDGRAAHVFLDYTYRDLSTVSNRRLFIDSDGKPASGQASLNPILYLPMTDAATAGTNEGTGGDFTVNGVLDTAGRGPNQFNCSASKFDGMNDYLSNASIPAGVDGKQLTISFFSDTRENGSPYIFDSIDSTDSSNVMKLVLRIQTGSSDIIRVTAYNGTDLTTIFSLSLVRGYHNINTIHMVMVSVDVSDTNKRHVIIDGIDETVNATFSNYNNVNIGFSKMTKGIICNDFNGGSEADHTVGEFYLDTSYIDLSTDNPFWDADANRPKPVRQVISETGTTPLIALPLRGDDAGNNLGTGGDFTVNSGPFTGARGGSEFWARTMATGSTATDRVQRTSTLTGASNGKQFTFVCAYKPDAIGSGGSKYLLYHGDGVTIDAYNFNQIGMSGYDTSGGRQLHAYATNNTNIRAGEWTYILMSFDMSDTSKRHFYYWDDSETDWVENLTVSTYSDSTLDFTNATTQIGQGDMTLGHVWFSTEYVDFSQESNRNKFFDQLRYPKDLASDGSTPTGNQPLIYMKFDDTSALGTNSGTGGNFTVNGTVIAGADVDPNA